jgi:5-methylthioadenosine/S-adenosylhomocysteine deaminase
MMAAMDEEALYVAELLGCVENIKNGNTSLVENIFMPPHATAGVEDAAFRALRDSGIRGTVARATEARHFDPRFCETAREQAERVGRLAGRWHGSEGGRLRLSIGPLLPWVLDESGFRETRRIARDNGLALHMHVAESPEFNLMIARHFGRDIRQVELLEEVGCLGPDVQAVACSDVSPREIEFLAASGTAVLFDPQTRLFWGTGFPPIRDFLMAGITCGVATNGAAANCGQDIFESMKYACATAKTAANNPRALTAARALRMATSEGARAIGRTETGSIEIGKRADLITVEARQPHLAPLFDPEKALVYSARGGDVRDAVIDGRVVMRDRKVLTVDENALLAEAEQVARRCAARAGIALPAVQVMQVQSHA